MGEDKEDVQFTQETKLPLWDRQVSRGDFIHGVLKAIGFGWVAGERLNNTTGGQASQTVQETGKNISATARQTVQKGSQIVKDVSDKIIEMDNAEFDRTSAGIPAQQASKTMQERDVVNPPIKPPFPKK